MPVNKQSWFATEYGINLSHRKRSNKETAHFMFNSSNPF